MNKSVKKLCLVALIAITLLAACNLPSGEKSSDADATATAEAAIAIFTHAAETAQIPSLSVPTATATPTQAAANTPAPTQKPPTPTNTPIPCNRASFVKDVSYPDNAEVPAGASFTKTWRLKNNGSCSWTSGYVLIFDHGDAMNAPSTVSITSGTVAPGATVDVSVELSAPSAPGTYQGNFMLRSPDNIVFGINANAQGPFWVKIIVPSPTPTPTPTTVPAPDLYITEITYDPVAPTMGNPVTVSVTVYNKGNAAAGAFTVEWWPANGGALGCSWPVASVNAKGGYVLTCSYTYAGWSTYTTSAIADSANTIAESDETNNKLEQTLSVGP